MKYELDLFGVVNLRASCSGAFCLCPSPRSEQGDGRNGLYRHVWYPALFDFALYVCVVTSLVFASKEFFS